MPEGHDALVGPLSLVRVTVGSFQEDGRLTSLCTSSCSGDASPHLTESLPSIWHMVVLQNYRCMHKEACFCLTVSGSSAHLCLTSRWDASDGVAF